MSKPASATGKLVLDYLEKHSDLPSLTLAKIIYKDHAAMFGSVDGVRSVIKYYRGRTGEYNRKNLSNKKFVKPLSEGINFSPWMPTEESVDETPYFLNKRRIGILSDLHIPNHRVTPINLAFSYFKDKKIDCLLLNGDLLDNTPFTRHDGKKPSAVDVKRWFDKTEMFLELCRDTFPDAQILWTEGNHDYWYKRWMYQHAWQLGDDPHFSLQERLRLDEYKIEFIPQERFVMAGKLAICHGHHLVKGIIAPVNAARGVYLKAKKSVLIGHVHVESSHTETDLHGDIITCWSTGCNCTLTPEYMPMAGKACHGFAYVEVEENGNYTVDNKRIHRGKML